MKTALTLSVWPRLKRGFRMTALAVVLGGGLAAASANAQETLTGVVSNSATGRALEGARVVLKELGRETITDTRGAYRFADIAAGVVTLNVSYTGLNPVEISASISPGAQNRQDVGLTADIYKLDKFVVAGEREGNAQAITIQRQSTGIKSVVSTDAFGSLGSNPADLLHRLPGVAGVSDGIGLRYIQVRGMAAALSTVTMDGNRIADAASAGADRQFQFTQVAADTISRMEVVKSPTPNMDADSIGGAINFTSKSAFDSTGERRISGQWGITYRMLDGIDEPRQTMALSYSEVFGGRLGVALNYSKRSHLAPITATTKAYQDKVDDPAFTYLFGTESYYLKQTRWGGGVKLDYKLSDTSRFYANFTRNRMFEPSKSSYVTYTTSQTVATRDAAGNLTGTGTIVPEYTRTVTEWRPLPATLINATGSSEYKHVAAIHADVGAVHKFKNTDLDYNLFFSKSVTNYYHQESFRITARGLGLRIEETDEPTLPRVTQTAGPSMTDIASYTENQYNKSVHGGDDRYKGGVINWKQQFQTVVPAWIQAGARVREQTRYLFRNPIRLTYVGADGVAGINPATGRSDDNLALFSNPNIIRWGRLTRYPLIPVPMFPSLPGYQSRVPDFTGPNVDNVIQEHPEWFVEDIALDVSTSLTNRQDFKETIKAGYVMGNVAIGKLTVLGGVRVERTEVEGNGALQYLSPEERARRAAWVGPVTNDELRRRTIAEYSGRVKRTGEYQQVFPGLHFKYQLMPNVQTRLSYSTNIGRPSIGQLIPRTTVNDENKTISTSNPSLRPQLADNFDASVEYYFEPVGMLSAGVFLKEIKQFIFTQGGVIVPGGNENGFGGEYAGYTLTTQYNGGSARIRGFELAYQQQFTFLPGIWSGLGVFANYSRNETYGNYGGATATTQVAGFIPEAANFGISYIRGRASLRFQFAHVGKYLISVSPSRARLQYIRGRDILDIKTVFKIAPNFDFYLDVNNLFNATEYNYAYEGDRRSYNYKTGPQFLAGVNARF